MCDFKKLAFSEHAYAVRCTECSHYQVRFGTSMLTLSGEEFAALFKTVAQSLYSTAKVEAAYLSEETKNIVINTPASSMCLILNRKELQQLHEILDKADNEIKALSLLKLFK